METFEIQQQNFFQPSLLDKIIVVASASFFMMLFAVAMLDLQLIW